MPVKTKIDAPTVADDSVVALNVGRSDANVANPLPGSEHADELDRYAATMSLPANNGNPDAFYLTKHPPTPRR